MNSQTLPLLAAYYWTGFRTSAYSGVWNYWQQPSPRSPQELLHDPEKRLPNGERDIASVYMPVIGAYDSSDPDVCEYHLLLAKAGGWPSDPANDDPLKLLLRTAENLDLSLALALPEERFFPPSDPEGRTRSEAVNRARDFFLRSQNLYFSSPAYLRLNGNPVLVLREPQEEKPGDPPSSALLPGEWDRIQSDLQSRLVLIRTHRVGSALPDFSRWDSVCPRVNWNGEESFAAPLEDFWAASRRALGQGRYAFLSGMVAAGCDNRGLGLEPPHVSSRQQGAQYAAAWENSLEHSAQFICIHSWNDHREGSGVEPVKELILHRNAAAPGWGYRELITTREYASRLTHKKLWPAPALFLPERLYRLRKTSAPKHRGDRIRLYLLEGDIESATLGLEHAGV